MVQAMVIKRWVWSIVLLSAIGAPSWAAVSIPPLQHRVTDLTDTLSLEQQSDLERRLSLLESEKGSQVAVLLIPTTQPESIEQYSIRVVDAWKLGRQGIDDGVLLLLAKQDRTVRIEVGKGLEGVIPDAVANRIIDDDITPQLKQGDFYGGIGQGVDQLSHLIRGEPLPEPQARDYPNSDLEAGFFFPLFIGLFAGQFLRLLFGTFLGGLIGAVGAGLFGMLLGLPTLIAGLVGLFVFVLLLLPRGRSRPGGWYGGSGGFGGGGMTSGGGFSGGGGGFSGGGASGNW